MSLALWCVQVHLLVWDTFYVSFFKKLDSLDMQLFLSSLTYINTNICFQENGKTPETVFHSLLFFGRKLSPFQKIFVKFCIFFSKLGAVCICICMFMSI